MQHLEGFKSFVSKDRFALHIKRPPRRRIQVTWRLHQATKTFKRYKKISGHPEFLNMDDEDVPKENQNGPAPYREAF